ncbi:MAG: glycosyltransferase [Planctomycetota bacterium]
MNPRVSIIQHVHADRGILMGNLDAACQELDARGADDELILVDDSGATDLEAWVGEHFPQVRVLHKNRQEGRGKAHLMGAQAAEGDFLLLLGAQMRLRRGALGPMIAAMQGPNLFAVAPRCMNGATGEVELPGPVTVEQGRPVVLPSPLAPDEQHLRPVPFAGGHAFFVRREAFLSCAGFDDLFPAPYWDDVDLGLTAWRQGLRILEVPQAIVERHGPENAGREMPAELDRAAIERGRLLLYWKHLDDRAAAADHLQGLWRDAADAALGDRREELLWLALALEEVEAAGKARSRTGSTPVRLDQALQMSNPARI